MSCSVPGWWVKVILFVALRFSNCFIQNMYAAQTEGRPWHSIAVCVASAVATTVVLLLVFGTTGQTQLYAGPTLTARPVAQPVGVATPFIRAQSGSELHTVNVDSAEPVVPSVEHVELAADDNVDSTQNTELSSREALGFNLASLGLIVGMLWNAARGRRPSDLVLATTSGEASSESEPSSLLGKIAKTVTRIDFVLIAYFFFWYLGNYYYNIFNKVALNTAGGAAGFPMTIAAAQLFFGSLYGIFLWLAPDARKAPKLTGADLKAMLPVSICAAGAHASSVFALGAGAVSFAQIVKAAEPAFAAVLGTLFYGKVPLNTCLVVGVFYCCFFVHFLLPRGRGGIQAYAKNRDLFLISIDSSAAGVWALGGCFPRLTRQTEPGDCHPADTTDTNQHRKYYVSRPFLVKGKVSVHVTTGYRFWAPPLLLAIVWFPGDQHRQVVVPRACHWRCRTRFRKGAGFCLVRPYCCRNCQFVRRSEG